jgi:hypothetical protein
VNRRLYARLAELENASKAASLVSSAPWRDGSGIEELRQALRAHGFEQRETEGLMGTFARFLGITMQDLKVQLQEIMHGHANKAELTNEQHH